MKCLLLFFTPLLVWAGEPDSVTDLVERLRQLTFAGDQAAVARLLPELIGKLAEPNPHGALAWNQIGVHHAVQGNFIEAERAYRRAIALAEPVGAGRATLALLLLNLGQLYLESGGRASQAERILRRAFSLAEEAYDENSEELFNFICVLAVARNQAGDRSGARVLFERGLRIVEHSKDRTFQRGVLLANLAVLRAEEKQWNDAREKTLQALALLELNLGKAHPELIPTYINLAKIQRHFKRWDLASAALERARAITDTQLGPKHRYMVTILELSSVILSKTGRRSEAREQARRAKSIAASLPRAIVGETWVHVSELQR